MARKEEYIFGLDVGSSKTCALICRQGAESSLAVAGWGVAESRRWRRGNIANLDAAVASIREAVDTAESTAGFAVDSAYVGIAGTHIRGVNAQGGVSLGQQAREVTAEDVQNVVERAQSVSLPEDQAIVHVFPPEYLVDARDGIRDPIGMQARSLEVSIHLVTASSAMVQNVVNAANRAGIYVLGTVLEQMASAESNLTDEERELGVMLVDIGAGTAEVLLYEQGMVRHTAAIPVGGDYFTNDIAVGLRTPIPEAEQLKRCWGLPRPETRLYEEIQVSGVGERPGRKVNYSALAEILEPRAVELLELIEAELVRQGGRSPLGAGLVFTGGGALLKGLPEMAEKIFSLPIRVGYPAGLVRMGETLSEPCYSAVVGLVRYARRMQRHQELRQPNWGKKLLGLLGVRA